MVEVLGNAAGFKRATHESIVAANQLSGGLKRLAVSAETSASAQVQASVRKTSRMKQEVVAYRQIASASRKGSSEQVAAANLAAKAEMRLAKSMALTKDESRALGINMGRAERDLSRASRGALAGSGAFKSMGRSLAFGSLGFIGFFGVSKLLRDSVDAGVEAAAVQKQLAAQFRASGVALGPYQKQIDNTSARLSSFDDLA